MKIFKTILTIAAVLVLVYLLTINVYYSGDESSNNGKISIDGISDTVNVYIDDYGMPYVFSKNNEDLFFSAGYLIAQERLFQLSLINAIINGKIADILGEEYLEHDQYINKKNILFSKSQSTIEDKYRTLIESYCDGINNYIYNNSNELPISFKLTKSQPNKWSVSDVIAALDLMTNNYLTDTGIQTIQSEINKYYGESHSFGLERDSTNSMLNMTLEELALEYEIMELIGASGSLIGSEGFIVPATGTLNDNPFFIFSNNWGYRAPGKWFDIYLNGGDYSVSGTTITGFPLPIVGNNEASVFANIGKTTELSISSLFDLAQNNPINDISSLIRIDTSGNIYGTGTQFIDVNADSLNNLEIDDIVEIYHQKDNSKKIALFDYIISNYGNLDNRPELKNLNNWNGDESSTSSTALQVNIIYKNLIEAIFKDELNLIHDDLFNMFLRNTKLVENALEWVLRNSESPWLDDINTINYTESTKDIINKAIDKSIIEIKSKYGNTSYLWGKVNPPSFEHILEKRNSTKLITDIGTEELVRRGSNGGRFIQEFLYDDNLTPVSTTVLTKIYDLSNLSVSYSRNIPGQSGNPASPYYSDQIGLYKNESLRKIIIDENTIKNSDSFEHLIIYPSE